MNASLNKTKSSLNINTEIPVTITINLSNEHFLDSSFYSKELDMKLGIIQLTKNKEINKKRKIKNSNRDSLAQNNMQLKEILFRFILTKEEYEVLMKEKAKIQDILIN